MTAEVVGFGQCCWDRIGQVDAYPAKDQKAELLQSCEQGGGPVATALVTLARLGTQTTFFGTTGGDPEATWIRQGLQDEGVDCRHLQSDPAGTSQKAWIIVEAASGSRNIFWERGARRPFSFSDETRDIISRSRVLLLDGLDVKGSLRAAEFARNCGVLTVLDGGSVREGTTELLPLIDHLVVSEKFAVQYSGESEPERGLEALAVHNGAVTVTAGARGSWSLVEGSAFHQPAFSVQTVDTTGCGDVFHGGYVYGLLQDWELPRVVRFAAACAALKARAMGGRTAIASLGEVEAFCAGASG